MIFKRKSFHIFRNVGDELISAEDRLGGKFEVMREGC
jgi:hypothetical protein